jgi:uncharacterized membrane protein
MKKALRILLVFFYILAGCYHFVNPDFYLGLIPGYLPYPEFINYASGFVEILLGAGVAFPGYRKISVYGIIGLLVLFIPSHVYFIRIGSCVEDGLCVSPWISWSRLLVIHPLLMYWAWIVRK